VIDVPRHDDVRRQLRGVAQDLRNEDASLAVERRVLTEIIDALEELRLGAVNGGKRGELFFEGAPDRQRVKKHFAPVERRHEHVRPEGLFDLLSEETRDFETALFVETGRGASTKAIHSSFS